MVVRVPSIAALAILFLMGSSAQAAVLEDIRGVVLIDRGGGYSVVTSPTELNPGDSVIVNPGASAQIAYDDGCKVPIQPGAVVAARKHSPCSKEGAAEDAGLDGTESEQSSVFNSTTLLVGGAVVGLGVGAAVLLTADGDEGPASP